MSGRGHRSPGRSRGDGRAALPLAHHRICPGQRRLTRPATCVRDGYYRPMRSNSGLIATRRLHRRTLLGRLAATFGVVGVGVLTAAGAPATAFASNPIASRTTAQGAATKIITIGEWQPVSIMNTLMTSEGGNVIS